MPDGEGGLSRVTAVVLNWNGAPDCIGLMRSLESAFVAGMQMVLVDNGSVDDSVAVLREFFDSWPHRDCVGLVETGDNLGFTAGVNFGVDRALRAPSAADYILLVNPDGAVGDGAIEELLTVSDAAGAAIVSCATKEYDLGAWPKVFFARPGRLRVAGATGRWRLVGQYGGACALFRVRLIRRLIAKDGYFQDPGIFMYWDEWEVTLRCRMLGVRIAMARDAHYEHFGPSRGASMFASTGFRQYYGARNSVLLARRHLPGRIFWGAFAVHVCRDLTWLARLALRRERTDLRAYLAGTLDGLRGRTGRWKKHPARPPANG